MTAISDFDAMHDLPGRMVARVHQPGVQRVVNDAVDFLTQRIGRSGSRLLSNRPKRRRLPISMQPGRVAKVASPNPKPVTDDNPNAMRFCM